MKKNKNIDMEKPVEPVAPDFSNKTKYPLPATKEGKNYLGEPIYLTNEDYVRDYRKYQEDTEKYKLDIIKYEQLKFIKDIQRSSIELCLKKYKITKR